MTDAVQLGIISLIASGVGGGSAALFAYLTNKANRKEKADERESLAKEREDEREAKRIERQDEWDRQDKVAAEAEKVAKQAQEAARLLKESNENIASATKETSTHLRCLEEGQLEIKNGQRQIHTLVNSNLTASKSAELAAVKGQLIYLRRLVERDPTPEDLAEVESLVAQIAELETALADRMKQTEVAEEQAKEGKKVPATEA